MAVYTHVEDEPLAAFLRDYDLGTPRLFLGIAEGVENSNFLLETERGRYILTVYEKRVKAADLPFFLGLMDHLAERGIDCPLPIRRIDGGMFGELLGKPATIVSFLKGRSVTVPQPWHLARLGESTAKLHLAGADFTIPRENDLSLSGWHRLADTIGRDADGILPGMADVIADELAYQDTRYPTDLPGGVIHADLFTDNVFFEAERLSGIIDFYFACNDSFAYELAIILNAWCFERTGEFNITKARALLDGYQKVRPLSEAELAALPVLARGSALRFMLTRAHDWIHRVEGAIVTVKNPMEYWKKLQFHRKVSHPREYGL